MKRQELPMREIAEKYENGINTEILAIQYNVSSSLIRKRLMEYYKKIGIEKTVLKGGAERIELPIKEIVEQYERGISTGKLVIEYGVSTNTISNRLKEYYEERETERPSIKGRKEKIELPIKEIVEQYESGISTEKIAKEYGVSGFTINRRLDEYYEEKQTKRPVLKCGPRRIETPIEEIMGKYESGSSVINIAVEYDIPYSTLCNRIKEYYKLTGKKPPRVLKSVAVIEAYLKKGLTIEQIIEIAASKNIVVSQELLDKINNKSMNDDTQR